MLTKIEASEMMPILKHVLTAIDCNDEHKDVLIRNYFKSEASFKNKLTVFQAIVEKEDAMVSSKEVNDWLLSYILSVYQYENITKHQDKKCQIALECDAFKEMRNNRGFMLSLISQNPLAFPLLSPELLQNKLFIITVFYNAFEGVPQRFFEYAPEAMLQNNDEIISALFAENPQIVKYARLKVIENESLLLSMIKKDAIAAQFVSEKFQFSEAFWLGAMERNSAVFQYLPEEFKTKAFFLKAIKLNASVFQYLPEKLKTEQFSLDAIRQNGLALQYVPEKFKTEGLIWTAIEQNILAIQYIPVNLQYKHIVVRAAFKDSIALQFCPKEFRTKDIATKVVSRNGLALKHVDEELKTEDVIWAAINQNGLALQYVPEALKTEEVIWAAIKQNGLALQYVPEGLKTEDVIWAAANQNGLALQYVPEELKTEDVIWAAVNQNGLALQYVPDELQSEYIALVAMHQNPSAFKYASNDLKNSYDFQIIVITYYGEAFFKFAPNEVLTNSSLMRELLKINPNAFRYASKDVILSLVQEDGHALQFASVNLKNNPTILQAAIKSNPFAIAHVPAVYLGRNVGDRAKELAVGLNGLSLQYIPVQGVTPRIIELAINQTILAMKYVPETLFFQNIVFLSDKINQNQNPDALLHFKQHMLTLIKKAPIRFLQNTPAFLLTDQNFIFQAFTMMEKRFFEYAPTMVLENKEIMLYLFEQNPTFFSKKMQSDMLKLQENYSSGKKLREEEQVTTANKSARRDNCFFISQPDEQPPAPETPTPTDNPNELKPT